LPPVGGATSALEAVALVLPELAALGRPLDYAVPPALADRVEVGTVVRIPLQGRRARGWVLAYPAPPTPGVHLRPIAKVSGFGPSAEMVDVAQWAAWRWAGALPSLLGSASPDGAAPFLPPPRRRPPSSGHAGAAGPEAAPPDPAVTAVVGEALAAGGLRLLRLPPDYDTMTIVRAALVRAPLLVIVPSAARAAAGAAALRARGIGVALVPDEWSQARAGADVVIGARGAAWAPCPDMGAVVVFDAHDEGLAQGQSPFWSASLVAAERARRRGVSCLWVSSCPSLELAAEAGGVTTVSRARERAGWPALRLVDRRDEDPRSGLYSAPVVELIRGGGRVICVLNRTGRARLLACRACGELARCERCGTAVAQIEEHLVCRRCALARPEVCAHCGSDRLAALRLGVSRVREELEALAGRPVGEVTAATGALPDASLLIGTEAVLHRGRGADAVVFLDFDQELLAARYRAGEQALALLARAARLVGGRQGTVVVQTRVPDHPALRAGLLGDPTVLAEAEAPTRQLLGLPPYRALARLSGEGAGALADALRSSGRAQIVVGGPLDQAWLVSAPDHGALCDALAAVGRPAGRVRIEVDPQRH
jgi:primosomal protein N' (replication factor Y)